MLAMQAPGTCSKVHVNKIRIRVLFTKQWSINQKFLWENFFVAAVAVYLRSLRIKAARRKEHSRTLKGIDGL